LVGRVADLLNHPLSTYYLLLGTTLLLLALGLIMVLSASSIESFRVHGSAYTLAQRQGLFAVLGVIGMFFAARTSVQFWRGLAWPIIGAAFILRGPHRIPGDSIGLVKFDLVSDTGRRFTRAFTSNDHLEVAR